MPLSNQVEAAVKLSWDTLRSIQSNPTITVKTYDSDGALLSTTTGVKALVWNYVKKTKEAQYWAARKGFSSFTHTFTMLDIITYDSIDYVVEEWTQHPSFDRSEVKTISTDCVSRLYHKGTRRPVTGKDRYNNPEFGTSEEIRIHFAGTKVLEHDEHWKSVVLAYEAIVAPDQTIAPDDVLINIQTLDGTIVVEETKVMSVDRIEHPAVGLVCQVLLLEKN